MYLKKSKTIVIKIGSTILIDEKRIIRKKWLMEFAKDIKSLLDQKKNEIVVLNKIDLLEDKDVKKIKNDFLKKYKVNLITLSTLDKKSISKIKSKLIKYVS